VPFINSSRPKLSNKNPVNGQLIWVNQINLRLWFTTAINTCILDTVQCRLDLSNRHLNLLPLLFSDYLLDNIRCARSEKLDEKNDEKNFTNNVWSLYSLKGRLEKDPLFDLPIFSVLMRK